MIQPTLVNRKEYKVVVLGGKPAHICPTAKGVAKAFSTPPEIMQFAEDAVKELKKARPATIDDGLLRVDIMCTRDNRMVVNEFESLEAAYIVKNDKYNVAVNNFLINYWETKLTTLFLH